MREPGLEPGEGLLLARTCRAARGRPALPLPTAIVPSPRPEDRTPRQVGAAFRRLLDEGVVLRPAGTARRRPRSLLREGYTPKHEVRLFGTSFYLTNVREDANFRFLVAYVLADEPREGRREAFPRIFYKDQSLVWRCATHVIRTEDENWIGKGDLKDVVVDGEMHEVSAEETTDLPYEIQPALDEISRRGGLRQDHRAVFRVLRRAPEGRFEPYADFLAPRRRAAGDPENLVHGGRYVAWFTRPGDPTSLRFASGYEPDFEQGLLERHDSRSRLYGGEIRKYRILSRNRRIQYLFVAAPKLVWIIPPQTLVTRLTSYGVRPVDVHADEDAFVPGYEYHYLDHACDPPRLMSQIPTGFAGAQSEIDPHRADAGPWLEKLPVIREFRRKVLGDAGAAPRLRPPARAGARRQAR